MVVTTRKSDVSKIFMRYESDQVKSTDDPRLCGEADKKQKKDSARA